MKVYIAGPMTGIPDYNFPAFHEAAALLRHNGFEVFNPAESFGGDVDRPRADYARVDLAAVMASDGIVLLAGWGQSRGAVTELRVAADLDLRVMTLYDLAAARPVLETRRIISEGSDIIVGSAISALLLGRPPLPATRHTLLSIPTPAPVPPISLDHADQDGFQGPSPEGIASMNEALRGAGTLGASAIGLSEVAQQMSASGLLGAILRPTSVEGATLGVKYDAGKVDFSLLDPQVLHEWAACMTKGAAKYEPHQWRKGMPTSRVIAAIHRHLNAFERGEDLDPDSGDHHLLHVLCNTMFALVYQRTHPELDDRIYRPSEASPA